MHGPPVHYHKRLFSACSIGKVIDVTILASCDSKLVIAMRNIYRGDIMMKTVLPFCGVPFRFGLPLS
jgi:hypothetical protein